MKSVERWLPVVSYEGRYEVSDHGRVRSLDRDVVVMTRWGFPVARRLPGRMLNPHRTPVQGKYRKGELAYSCVSLSRHGSAKQCRVHRLVLAAFVGPCPEGHEGAHGDGDTSNNRLSNLTWKTPAANSADRVRHGRQTRKARWQKLTPAKVRRIRAAVAAGASQTEQARKHGVHPSHVCKLVNGSKCTTVCA